MPTTVRLVAKIGRKNVAKCLPRNAGALRTGFSLILGLALLEELFLFVEEFIYLFRQRL
jgi:hypothetical protein